MSFYDTQNLADFKVEDIPTPNDVKQSLATATSELATYTTTQRDSLTTAGILKAGVVIVNTTADVMQKLNNSGSWVNIY